MHARLEGDAARMRAGGHSFCLAVFIQCMGRRLTMLSLPPLHEGTIQSTSQPYSARLPYLLHFMRA